MVNAGGVLSLEQTVSVNFIRGIAFGIALAAVANIAITWALLGGVV